MKKTWLVFCLVVFFIFLFCISFILGEVRINEVMYNPENNTNSINEWIEIYTDEPLNLTSSKIKVKSYEDILYNCSDPNSQIIIESNTFFVIVSNMSYNINSPDILTVCNFKNKISSYGLANDGSNLSLLNSVREVIASFNYTSSLGANGDGKSLQYYDNLWQSCTPTPGQPNNCTQTSTNPTCTSSYSCGNWTTCSGSSQTRTCTNTTANCTTATYNVPETQSCTTTNTTTNTSIYLKLNWTSEDIINSEDFDIEVNAFNLLDKDYDIKIWLEFKENDTIISDRYDKNEEKWKSGTYFVVGFFSESGNKTEDITLRIREDYTNFSGKAKLLGKIKYGDDTLYNVSYNIDILKKIEENNITQTYNADNSKILATSMNNTANEGEIIKLGSKISEIDKTEGIKTEKSTIYKSKNEYIKEYAIYGFSILCIFLIILLLIDKK